MNVLRNDEPARDSHGYDVVMDEHRCDSHRATKIHSRMRMSFCTFFLTSLNKRIMIRLDKSLTSLHGSKTQPNDESEERARRVFDAVGLVAKELWNIDADQPRPASHKACSLLWLSE